MVTPDEKALNDAIDANLQDWYQATLTLLPDNIRDVLSKLNEDTFYLFRTTFKGSWSGDTDSAGLSKVTHIGKPIMYVHHVRGWLDSHVVVSVTAKEIDAKWLKKRQWRPVYDDEEVKLKNRQKVAGEGIDVSYETRKKRQVARDTMSPADLAKYLKRSRATAKGNRTKSQTPKARAKEKRKYAAQFKYERLLKSDGIEAAEAFQRRSKAAQKAAKTRAKNKKK